MACIGPCLAIVAIHKRQQAARHVVALILLSWGIRTPPSSRGPDGNPIDNVMILLEDDIQSINMISLHSPFASCARASHVRGILRGVRELQSPNLCDCVLAIAGDWCCSSIGQVKTQDTQQALQLGTPSSFVRIARSQDLSTDVVTLLIKNRHRHPSTGCRDACGDWSNCAAFISQYGLFTSFPLHDCCHPPLGWNDQEVGLESPASPLHALLSFPASAVEQLSLCLSFLRHLRLCVCMKLAPAEIYLLSCHSSKLHSICSPAGLLNARSFPCLHPACVSIPCPHILPLRFNLFFNPVQERVVPTNRTPSKSATDAV